MNILALDLGYKRFGWAVNCFDEIESGNESAEIRALDFMRRIEDFCFLYKLDVICYENACFQKGEAGRHWQDTRVATEIAAQTYGIPIRFVHTATLKLCVTGNGHAKKADMIAAVNQIYGLNVTDDNEADALGVLYWFEQNKEELMQ